MLIVALFVRGTNGGLARTRGASWWQRRTRVERRISLLATVFLFVAIGLAIAMASLIYRVNTQERHGVAAQGAPLF